MTFIELHYNGVPYMLNFDMIISIVPGTNGKTEIYQENSNERFICDETHKEIMKKLDLCERGKRCETVYAETNKQ